MKISKETYTFYFTHAMLLACRKYIAYLNESGAVVRDMKTDLSQIGKWITRFDNTCSRSIEGHDQEVWQKEWTDRDWEVFGQIFANLADMDEPKRLLMEELSKQVLSGAVKAA